MDLISVEWYVRWANYAQIVTPIVAIIGFVFLWLQIQAAIQQARIAEDQAKTAKEQVTIAKDTLKLSMNALMPRLHLNVSYVDISHSSASGSDTSGKVVVLTVTNIGPGMASCALLTMRDDISPEAGYDPVQFAESEDIENAVQKSRITDFSIGSNQTVKFLLPLNHQFNVPKERPMLSSMTLYYKDVYSRTFCSKVLYVWKFKSDRVSIDVFGREYREKETVPLNPYSTGDIRSYYDAEGGRILLDNPAFRILHFEDTRRRVFGMSMEGNDFTGDLPIELVSYDFDNQMSLPVYILKVDIFPKFILQGKREHNGEVSAHIHMPEGQEDVALDKLGLHAKSDLPKQKYDLYAHVTKVILRSQKTDLQKEYLDIFTW